jgi:peptidoglycan/LPS O-acetylase OafA/YrhL
MVGVALAYAITTLVWRHVAGQTPTTDHAVLNAAFDKWHLAPLRLINFFALLVLAMRFGPALMERLPRLRWLEVLGAASLPVFCTHLVLVLIALLAYGAANPERPIAIDAAIVAVSFAVLTAVATISGRIDAYAAAFKARRAARRSTGRARGRRGAPRSPSSTTHSRLR